MATRNILDSNGTAVGTLTLPDDTSEAVWTAALAAYSTKKPMKDVTPRQMRQALILSGVSLASIDAAIATMPDPAKSLAQTEWEYSTAFQRERPLVAQVAALLGWTNDQLDALWELAASL